MNKSVSLLTHKITALCELQLFLTLCSLPFLIGWGLPFSLLTFVGNIVFTPLLAAFLLLSSLIFITELIGIPNNGLIYLLEYGTRAWTWILSWCDDHVMIYFCKPPFIILALIPVLALCVLAKRRTLSREKRIGLFIALACLVWGVCSWYKPTSKIAYVPCSTGKLTLIYNRGKTVLVDTQGVLSRISAQENWIKFQLVPTLACTTGSPQIDGLVVAKCGLRVFQLLKLLIEKKLVAKIYLPYWDVTVSKKTWRAFFEMKNSARDHNCTIIRYSTHIKTVPFEDPSSYLTFCKQELPLSDANRKICVLRATYHQDGQEMAL